MSATTTSHARRTAERERVEEACRALLSSDGWRRWVRARSAFHSYSLNNQLLIVLQSPNATRVAGFHTWRKLGRQVRKGEKSIRILAPLLLRESDANARRYAASPAGAGHRAATKQLIGYRSVGVFDLSQTDPIPGADPLPLEPPSAPISGDSHAHLRPSARRARREPRVHGQLRGDQRLRRILRPREPSHRRRRARSRRTPRCGSSSTSCCHAHGADYKTYDRAACEVIVDCATHIACATIGLDVSGETIPYIAGWGEADDALAAVTRFAGVIDGLAASIEAAIS